MEVRLAIFILADELWPGNGWHRDRLVAAIVGGPESLREFYAQEGDSPSSGFQPAQGQAIKLIAKALEGDQDAEGQVVTLAEGISGARMAGALTVTWDCRDLRPENMVAFAARKVPGQ